MWIGVKESIVEPERDSYEVNLKRVCWEPMETMEWVLYSSVSLSQLMCVNRKRKFCNPAEEIHLCAFLRRFLRRRTVSSRGKQAKSLVVRQSKMLSNTPAEFNLCACRQAARAPAVSSRAPTTRCCDIVVRGNTQLPHRIIGSRSRCQYAVVGAVVGALA